MKKLIITYSTVLFILAVVGCSPTATSTPNAATTSDAAQTLQDYYQALTEGDIERALSYVADDAVFIDPMGKYIGKENIRKVYAPQMNKGGRWEPSNIIDVNGKGRLVYDFTAYINDNPVFSGKGLTVVKDGRIIFDGSEASWKGECKRDPAQSFCSD